MRNPVEADSGREGLSDGGYNWGYTMDERVLREHLAELQEALGVPIQPELSAKAVLANLRLRLKYMQFDLEATRRENKALRRLLEVVEGEEE